MTRPPTEAAPNRKPWPFDQGSVQPEQSPSGRVARQRRGDSWLNIGHLTLTIVNTATLSTVAIQAGEAHADPMPLSGRLADVVLSCPCPRPCARQEGELISPCIALPMWVLP